MATWIQRGKTFLKLTYPSDAADPTNAQLLEQVKAVITRRATWWKDFIARLDALSNGRIPNCIQNPAADSDLWDIGTMDDSEPPVFVPLSVGDRNSAMAAFCPWAYRVKELRPALRDFREANEALGAPAVTETPAQARARRRAETEAYADTEVGAEDAEITES